MLLVSKVGTKLVIDREYVEYAAVAVLPSFTELNSIVERRDLPTGSLVLMVFNDGEGAETISQAAYSWLLMERFWPLLGVLCASFLVTTLLKQALPTSIAHKT